MIVPTLYATIQATLTMILMIQLFFQQTSLYLRKWMAYATALNSLQVRIVDVREWLL